MKSIGIVAVLTILFNLPQFAGALEELQVGQLSSNSGKEDSNEPQSLGSVGVDAPGSSNLNSSGGVAPASSGNVGQAQLDPSSSESELDSKGSFDATEVSDFVHLGAGGGKSGSDALVPTPVLDGGSGTDGGQGEAPSSSSIAFHPVDIDQEKGEPSVKQVSSDLMLVLPNLCDLNPHDFVGAVLEISARDAAGSATVKLIKGKLFDYGFMQASQIAYFMNKKNSAEMKSFNEMFPNNETVIIEVGSQGTTINEVPKAGPVTAPPCFNALING